MRPEVQSVLQVVERPTDGIDSVVFDHASTGLKARDEYGPFLVRRWGRTGEGIKRT